MCRSRWRGGRGYPLGLAPFLLPPRRLWCQTLLPVVRQGDMTGACCQWCCSGRATVCCCGREGGAALAAPGSACAAAAATAVPTRQAASPAHQPHTRPDDCSCTPCWLIDQVPQRTHARTTCVVIGVGVKWGGCVACCKPRATLHTRNHRHTPHTDHNPRPLRLPAAPNDGPRWNSPCHPYVA